MKTVFEQIELIQKQRKKKIIIRSICVSIITLFVILFILFLSLFEYIVKTKYFSWPAAIALISTTAVVSIVGGIIIAKNNVIDSNPNSYLFDYLAKMDFSSMHSIKYKEIRKYFKESKLFNYLYTYKKVNAIIKYDFGCSIEGQFGYMQSSGKSSHFVPIIMGISYAFEMKTNYDFIYLKSNSKIPCISNFGYRKEKTDKQIGFWIKKNQEKESTIKDIVEKLNELFIDNAFYIKCTNTHVFISIEKPSFFTIDESKTVMEYQEIFKKYEEEIAYLREKMEHIICLNLES